MVSKVKRHVFKVIGQILGLFDEALDGLAQKALVLRLRVEFLARELDNRCSWVVAGPREFDEFRDGFGGEREVCGVEFDDDFVCGGVRFVEVGGVAEAEGGGVCWGGEWFGEFWYSSLASILSARSVIPTVQQRHFPRYKPVIMPQLPVLSQFSVTVARQIVAKVIFVHAHAFLALGPETGGDLALVVLFDYEVLVLFEIEGRGERHAAFAFSYGLGHDVWVEGFEIRHEAGELRSGNLLFSFFGRCGLGFCIFGVWRRRSGRGVRGGLHVFIEAARR